MMYAIEARTKDNRELIYLVDSFSQHYAENLIANLEEVLTVDTIRVAENKDIEHFKEINLDPIVIH